MYDVRSGKVIASIDFGAKVKDSVIAFVDHFLVLTDNSEVVKITEEGNKVVVKDMRTISDNILPQRIHYADSRRIFVQDVHYIYVLDRDNGDPITKISCIFHRDSCPELSVVGDCCVYVQDKSLVLFNFRTQTSQYFYFTRAKLFKTYTVRGFVFDENFLAVRLTKRLYFWKVTNEK